MSITGAGDIFEVLGQKFDIWGNHVVMTEWCEGQGLDPWKIPAGCFRIEEGADGGYVARFREFLYPDGDGLRVLADDGNGWAKGPEREVPVSTLPSGLK